MKRALWSLLFAASVLIGCSDPQDAATLAELAGPYDLVAVGDLIFVTSADRNELRVLDTASDPRGFLSGPNPLEPLAIPVVPRPVGLAKDVRYGADGKIAADGPYVYARSSGASEISVVAADRERLVRVLTVHTEGPVTALAAVGPDPANGRPNSTLYYAVQAGLEARLYSEEVVGPDDPRALNRTLLKQYPPSMPGDPAVTIAALLAMPSPTEIVVATREQSGRAGGTELFDALARTAVQLEFGKPMRLLATHEFAEGSPSEPELPAGSRVFGVVDEAACVGQESCTGVLAVTRPLAAGQPWPLAANPQGVRMVPLRVGRGIPTGLTVAARAALAFSSTVAFRPPLTGIVAMSDGDFFLFYGDKAPRVIDVEEGLPSLGASGAVNANGTAVTGVPLPPTLFSASGGLSEPAVRGAVLPQTIRLTFEGFLPGLFDLPRDPARPTVFDIPLGNEAYVAPGDLLVLRAGTTDCQAQVRVATVSPGALTTAEPLPSDCADFPRFSVRASGAKPYVVAAGRPTTPLRAGPGDTLVQQQTRFIVRDDTPAMETLPPLTLTFSADARPLAQDQSYFVQIDDGYTPYRFGVNTGLPGLTSFTLPASVVHSRAREAAYVSYPSANGVLEIRFGNLRPDSAAGGEALDAFL